MDGPSDYCTTCILKPLSNDWLFYILNEKCYPGVTYFESLRVKSGVNQRKHSTAMKAQEH